ncbi:MAG: hypothetical protein LWY06_04925 [Firmicutes bacterium]|nr:hypothetical protein [Bacillota bacterium]
MKKYLFLAVLAFCAIFFAGCTKQEPATSGSGEGAGKPPAQTSESKPAEPAKVETPAPAMPKFDDKVAALFTKLEKMKPDEDVRNSKDFEELKKLSLEYAKKRDPKFIENLFIVAENGPTMSKKAANELLCSVISDYKGTEWKEHNLYRDRAIAIVTSHKDPEFRKGCWGFLTYYYEPENITPGILKGYEASKDDALKLEILQQISSPASSCFIEKNEEALDKICLPLAKDEKATPEMRTAAIDILAYTGKKDAAVKKELEALKADKDEKVKKSAEDALGKLGK